MTKPSSNEGVDLAALVRPIQADLPHVGRVSLRVRTVSFLSWLDRGGNDGRLPDGPSFVRDLLRERTAPASEGKAGAASHGRLPDGVTATLDEAAVEEVAAAMLPILDPHWRWRTDRGSAVERTREDVPADDRPSSSLLSRARAYSEGHRGSMRSLADRLRRMHPDIVEAARLVQGAAGLGLIGRSVAVARALRLDPAIGMPDQASIGAIAEVRPSRRTSVWHRRPSASGRMSRGGFSVRSGVWRHPCSAPVRCRRSIARDAPGWTG